MAERKITAEEYNALKNQERAEAYELLSAGTQKLLSGDELKSYAEMQAKLFNFSASNVILIREQNDKARWVRSYDDWKTDGITPKKGERGLMTLVMQRYQRHDGSIGQSSKVVRAFDVMQTTAANMDIAPPNYKAVPEAIMHAYPAAVEVSELPDEAYALYDPNSKLIKVREGLEPEMKVFVIAREHSVHMLTGENSEIRREDVLPQAELAAYILTKHYGLDAPAIDFGKIAANYPGKEEKEVRSELGGIKFISERIDRKVREAIELSRTDKREER